MQPFSQHKTTHKNNKKHKKWVEKKDSKGIAVLLREGISFLWGIAKNYIMYWGVTSSIIADPHLLVNAKLAQTLQT